MVYVGGKKKWRNISARFLDIKKHLAIEKNIHNLKV